MESLKQPKKVYESISILESTGTILPGQLLNFVDIFEVDYCKCW